MPGRADARALLAAVGLRGSNRQRSPAGGRRRGHRRYAWAKLTTGELLGVRLCDLGLEIAGTPIEPAIDRVRAELAQAGLRLRPHFWLSDEWFSPEGVPGVAVPFYLAHPRLMRLERAMMLEVEGGTRRECLMLLRHEIGHAVQHAFELHKRRRWQRMFGCSSQPYPDSYLPNPASKRFVQHLDAWYAQSHPDEDFAETFAVWLAPRTGWRKSYVGWPALEKLEYVDALMRELRGVKPRIASRTRPDSLSTLKITLGEHYERKREHYSVGSSTVYDRDLLRLFTPTGRGRRGQKATAFLRRHRREIRELVARWTGGYQLTLDQVLKELIGRCRELDLRACGNERELKLNFAIMLAVHSIRCLYRGHSWRAV